MTNKKPYCLKCAGQPTKDYEVDLCEKHYNEQEHNAKNNIKTIKLIGKYEN